MGTLNGFCGSKFWDYEKAWNTTDPDLSPCFQDTVLVWIPCGMLWLFSPLETYWLLKSTKRLIPWTALNITKLVITMLLFSISLAEFIYAGHEALSNGVALPSVYFYTPPLKTATFMLAASLLLAGMKRGRQSSGILFLFWFVLLLCGAVTYRSYLKWCFSGEKEWTGNARPGQGFFFGAYMAYYPLVLVQLVLNCFSDAKPMYRQHAAPPGGKESPESGASFLSKLLFSWIYPLIIKGYKKPLENTDLWALGRGDCTENVVPRFDKFWHREVARVPADNERGETNACYSNHKDEQVKFSSPPSSKKKNAQKPGIIRPLIMAFGPTFLLGGVLKLGHDVLQFVSPQLLRAMIAFVGSNDPAWKGILIALLMFASATAQSLALSAYFCKMYILGMHIRTCLISAIYRKSLVLSNDAKKESTTGEIVNLMSNDAQRFMELMPFLSMLWSAPLQIGLSLYFLWDILGPSVLAGVGIMVLMVPINGVLAALSKKLQTKQMKEKDNRLKLMNEILSGMKVLKLYAWEESFQKRVEGIRDREIRSLRRMGYLSAVQSFMWSCAPFLVSLMTFGTYVLVDEHHVLDAQKAFVALTLFDIMRFPLSMLPMLIGMLIQASVSVKRLNKFLNHEELEQYVAHDKDSDNPVMVEHGSFAWTRSEDPVLKDINLTVPKGSLVAIVGKVGSGKSSLISAILGDMERRHGTINTQGSVAYVAQQAWIQNATVRDNILFQKEMDSDRYNATVEQCALQSDLAVLPGGDMTEIGEKGINLSGGQKQRVSLARAVYSGADLYLLDDPLSAVDSHVGKHIFENVIGPQGVLKDKTRLLVTHGISYLPQMDLIVVLKDGQVQEQGTYQELMSRKGGALAEVLVQFLSEEANEDMITADDVMVAEDILRHAGADIDMTRQLSIQSRTSDEMSLTERRKLLRRISRQLSDSGSTNSRRASIASEKSRPVGLGPLGGKKTVGESPTKLVQDEATETGKVKWNVYLTYIRAVGVMWTILIVLTNMASHGFSIGSNLWLIAWSNDPPNPDGTQVPKQRNLRLGVYSALGFAQGVTILVSSLGLALGSLKGATLLHNGLLNTILRSPMSFFDTTPLGRVVNRFSKDVDTMDLTIPTTIRSWLLCFLQVMSTVLIITLNTPIFLAVAVPIGIVYYFIQSVYIASSRQLKRLESVTRSPIYTHFSETLSGATTIRAYAVQESFMRESNHRVDTNHVCYYPSIIANRWLAVRLELCASFVVLCTALFAVFGKETLDQGAVGLSLAYALSVTATMNWMVRMSCEFETNIVSVERIMEYTKTPTEALWETRDSKPPETWPQGGEVNYVDYATRYREGLDLVIRNLNISVKPGEKVGIVGRTGAGKSSMMLSLFRIVEPARGTILIDGIDISKIGLHDLRSKLTIIPQDPVLFSGTLRNNLDPFEVKSDTELWSALELSHLKSFVSGLEKGLQHEVAEGGENLSVGQRQLVCLARALLRKTKVLVLDEATAAVDMETDVLIQQTIRKEFVGCTVLTIAHRLNTIMDYDRILVLERGHVAEFDSPSNLLANKESIFYAMAKGSGLT
ncbi:multidrug resistance-associated protein 1-like isoform X2 [Ornithodoros turicata]|uniref:multidrug resistance-associated protein 1-like isoform X2 n=1 Tax=Ornithodoros turicata TaxID=34597 RepID=UPI003139B6D3